MFGPLFYLPFALVIPPEVYAVTSSVNTVYQFWVHTCLVRRLGPVEWIFSTPAHHRIHHDRRVHKNFGGMLIVWDRMFGTFLDEDECIRAALDKGTLIPETDALAEGNAAPAEVELFGVMKPVSSWLEAVWQHDGWVEFFPRVWRANSLWKCVQAIVKGPGFYTSTMHRVVGPNPDVDVQLRVVSKASLVARGYVLAQFVVTLAFGICFLFSRLTAAGTAAFVALLMSALTTQAMLLNAQSSAWHVESLRCIAFLAFANLFFTSENGLVGLERAIHVVMLLSLLVTCTQITFVHAKQA